MSSDNRKERMESNGIGRRESMLRKMDKCLEKLAEGLPGFSPKEFSRVLDAIHEYPAAAFRLLCKRMAGKDPALRALACWAVSDTLSPAAAERLKAMAFDELLPEEARAQASEYLARLGQPVDPEVLEMSLPNAAEILARLPVRVIESVRVGELADAVRRFASLEDSEKAVLIHRLGYELKGAAAPFYEKVACDDEYLGASVVAATSAFHLGACAGLMRRLAESDSKALHKAARKALYELKSAGFDVSGQPEAAQPEATVQEEPSGAGLPLFKAVASEDMDGDVFLAVAQQCPNGRLRTLTMIVNVWRGGVRNAGFRPDMSKAAFSRALKTWERDMDLRDAPLEEIQRVVARGLAANKALGLRVPLDFQLGRDMLGELGEEIAAAGFPFRCTGCGAALGNGVIQALKDAIVYDHVQVERRCQGCLEAGKDGGGK